VPPLPGARLTARILGVPRERCKERGPGARGPCAIRPGTPGRAQRASPAPHVLGHLSIGLPQAAVTLADMVFDVGVAFPRLSGVGIALVICFLVISLGLHEAAHGWVAWKRGDSTAHDLGRISLNPLVHIDPMMTVVVPTLLYMTTGFIFGGAKPVPVVSERLRKPLRDMMLVALAGPGTNFLLALVFLTIYKAVLVTGLYTPKQLLPQVMYASAMFNVLLAVFNLIPIPPLDGSRVMAWVLPEPLRRPYVSLERVGLILIVALIFFVPAFQAVLFSGIRQAMELVNFLTVRKW
jgi:Zn-dependent protease